MNIHFLYVRLVVNLRRTKMPVTYTRIMPMPELESPQSQLTAIDLPDANTVVIG